MGVLTLADESGAPGTPADGASLYPILGVLKYKTDGGTVHTMLTDQASGLLTNTMMATDVKIGSLAALATTDKDSVTDAINEVVTTIVGVAGGASATDQVLKEWTSGEDYEITAATLDSDGVPTTATVKWPDGSAGTFTTVTKNSTWLAVDKYTISHTDSGKTVTQDTVTRNSNGQVTTKPALTVA